jgi:hypothetical protein
MKRTKLVPALHNGVALEGYWVNPVDGTVWSDKRSKNLKQIKGSLSKGYRQTRLTTDGGLISLLLHRIVACTLIPFSTDGISKRDWKNTPDKIKNIILSQWCINHIDHDRGNYHPSNLEWATFVENSRASVAHKKSL